MKRLLGGVLMVAGYVLSQVPAYADAVGSNETLDLRAPDLQRIPLLAEIAESSASESSASEEPADVWVIGAPPEETPDFHLSRSGIGSLYWALRYPASVWKIATPIVPDDGSALSEDVRVQCELFTRPPAGRPARLPVLSIQDAGRLCP
jgi:hypothetical protein